MVDQATDTTAPQEPELTENAEMSLPHRTSTSYRKAVRAIRDAEDWQHSGAIFTDFLSPKEDIYDVFQKKDWAEDHWIVDGWIRARSNCIISGDSNVGKTYLALELAIAIVGGEQFLHHFDCDMGPVCYIGGEGDKQLLVRRLHNLLLSYNIDPEEWFRKHRKLLTLSLPPDYAARFPIPLSNKEFQDRLIDKIMSQPAHLRPRAFIWDPLTALVSDVDRDPNVVQCVINFLKLLNNESEAASFILHHPKKHQPGGPDDKRSRIRGESAWVAFADDVVIIEGDKERDNMLGVYSNKARDGAAMGDAEAMFGIRKEFRDVESPPGWASPGALKVTSFMYTPFTRRVVSPEEEGKRQARGRRKGEDVGLGQSPQLQGTIDDIMRVVSESQKPLERRAIREALGPAHELTFDEAFGQLIENHLIWSAGAGLTMVYYPTSRK